MENYSVLMSIYYKEKPCYLKQALDSIFTQTVKSNDVVLIEDGTLGKDLESIINEYESKYPELHVFRFVENRGLGFALNDGINLCKNNIIARMDTDDISKPYRMERQLQMMLSHPEYAMVGAWIDEFTSDIEHITSIRKVPESPEDIYQYAKKRCPVNHPVVMYRKKEVLAVGGYLTKYFPEDYFLWIKMLLNGCKFYNIQESLLWFRFDTDVFKRRGGWKYACDEAITQWHIYKMGFISFPNLLHNVGIRFLVRIAPHSVREFFYKRILRKRK